MTCMPIHNSNGSGSQTEKRLILSAPANTELSPYTGYTRAHWLEITERLIAGFLPYFNEETGLPDLGGREESGHYALVSHVMNGQLEAFDRSMVMVAYYIMATGNDTVPGYEGSISEPYIRQMRRGTNPDDPQFWGLHTNYQVNGTNFALVAQLCPEYFWDPFTEQEKQNILKYLQSLTRTPAYDNNHWYFHMVPVPLLEKYGMESNREFLTGAFDRILNWYRGDGWYIDGGNRGFDYYNLWGFQIFNNMLMYLDKPWQEQFGERITDHAQKFLKSFPYLFADDGGPIPFGRSTSYRFAINSSIGWAVVNNTSDMDPGAARRIASGCLKYFWEHGAMSEAGLIEPGWRGPNTSVAEPYTERGSPYWSVHGLVPIILPEEHPFWSGKEEPMPADLEGGRMPLPHAQMLLHVRKSDGDARLYPVGQPFGHMGRWQRGIKYAQLAYSSHLGWCAAGEGGPDLGAGRTGISYTGETWHYREQPRMRQVTANHLISEEVIPEPSESEELPKYSDFGELITHTLVSDHGEIHVFWHTSARPIYLHLGGYGISVPHGSIESVEESTGQLELIAGDNHSLVRTLMGPIGGLHHESVKVRPGWQHSHSFGGHGAFPYWRSMNPVKSNQPVVVFVEGARGGPIHVPEISLMRTTGELVIEIDGQKYNVDIPD